MDVLYNGPLPTFEEACALVSKLYCEKTMSFDVIEAQFRKSQIPIYLFGEVPQLSQYTKNCCVEDGKQYTLHIGVRRSRAIAAQYVESGCHDVELNMQRLKSTGMPIGDSEKNNLEEFFARQVALMCSDGYNTLINHCYVKTVYNLFMKYLDSHREEQNIIQAKKNSNHCH